MIIQINPTHDYLTIQLPDNSYNSLSIINAAGETVYEHIIETRKFEIDISNINNGQYHLIIRNNRGIKTKLFVKNSNSAFN